MKKSTIWAIAIIMGLSFLVLLFLQFSYAEEMIKMKKEQFDESVNRSLYQASRNLEMNETLRYLEKDVNETERRAFRQDSVMVDGLDGTIKHSHQFSVATDDGTVYSSFQMKSFEMKPASVPKGMIIRKDKSSISEAAKSMQEIVRKRYVYQKALLDEVVYNILYTASDKSLKERVNFKMLDQDIRAELLNNGVNIPYHFTVSTTDGREVYRCPDYTDEGEEYNYSQLLFRNDPQSKMGLVRIHFPEMNSYIFSSVRLLSPFMVCLAPLQLCFSAKRERRSAPLSSLSVFPPRGHHGDRQASLMAQRKRQPPPRGQLSGPAAQHKIRPAQVVVFHRCLRQRKAPQSGSHRLGKGLLGRIQRCRRLGGILVLCFDICLLPGRKTLLPKALPLQALFHSADLHQVYPVLQPHFVPPSPGFCREQTAAPRGGASAPPLRAPPGREGPPPRGGRAARGAVPGSCRYLYYIIKLSSCKTLFVMLK